MSLCLRPANFFNSPAIRPAEEAVEPIKGNGTFIVSGLIKVLRIHHRSASNYEELSREKLGFSVQNKE